MESINISTLKNEISGWNEISNLAIKELNLSQNELESIEQDVLDLTRALIKIPSVNYGEGKGDEVAVAEFVAALACL